jgi:hypothetical protein
MPMLQCLASLCATPPSGGVRFVFFAIPTGFVRVAHSTRGYFMPPRHAARLLNQARLEARGR